MPVVELPQVPKGDPVCPAGERVDGVTTHDGGCVCRIMQQDQEAEPGLDMNPRQLEVAREGTGGVYLTVKSDPSTVRRLCYGRDLPPITETDETRRSSYAFCPVWQERRKRDLQHKRTLFDAVEPDDVSMGVKIEEEPPASVMDDLDALAPPKQGAAR